MRKAASVYLIDWIHTSPDVFQEVAKIMRAEQKERWMSTMLVAPAVGTLMTLAVFGLAAFVELVGVNPTPH